MKNEDSFDLELEKLNEGKLPDSHVFNLGKPGEILQNCGFPAEHRIELAAARLRMKATQGNHPFDILDIKGLTKALQEPVAVFEYGDKNKSQNVIVNLEKDGKNFLVGVFFNQKQRGYEVSDIRGLFNRDNMDWMHWIQQGKMIYGNKEKIQVLAEQQRTNLAEVHSKEARTSSDSYYLDSVDNILQSFGDVKDIYTKDFPKYEEQKERFEIFKKFRSAYQKVEANNVLDAVQKTDEFYDALKSNNKEVIARYTDAVENPKLAEAAKSIIEELSFSQKEKSQELQYAEHLMVQGLDSLDSNKILHQTNSLVNKTTSTLVIDSNQAARIKAAREIKENMPNLSEKERAAAIAILEAGAKSQGLEFSEYVEKTFPDGIFGDIKKAENAAKQQGIKINGAVSVNGFGENVKAVIYAGKTADFSTWCHELSHIWQAQLTGELKQNAEEAFHVKDSDWQNSIYTFQDGHTDTSAEAFAYGFEDFLKNKAGEMATEDKKEIFAKFADYMSRTYNGVKQHIEINEKITSVYQKFVELDDNILAQAEKAVQMEKNAKLGIPEAERQKEVVKKLYQDTDRWLKAPNGNPTKLSEEQWIAVRTPNFKRWFGNWEFNENKIVKTVELNDSEIEFNHNNANEVEKWLKENLSGKSIIIDSSGAKVLIFNKGLKDSLKRHGEIQRNSYAVLEDLISKSELFDFIKSDGKSKHNGLLGQDVYYSALKVGENYYSVQFKFDVSEKYRTDSYKDHKIMEIKTAPLLYHGSKNAHAITSAVHDFTISQLTNGVKPNFSKIIDENGEPLVVYHGSPNKGFDVFDKNKIGSTTDYGIYGKGFYFSNKKNQAEIYGDTVDVFLNIRKPFILTDYHSPEQIADELDAYPEYFSIQNERVKPIGSFAKQGFVSYLEAKDYDGVIVKQTESTNEIVSFYANQIKSSIDNNGNFDINNDSILFQTAYHGSGANFDKFNTSEYGLSGEGYMAFGYGTYVTDSEDIAKDYASAHGKREAGKRNFYTVEIPDGDYLKWEKKVGVRTIKKVATGLEKLGIKNISFIRKDFRNLPLATQLNYTIRNESMTNKGSGKDLYITVGTILHSPADKETSKFFKDIGFSGIEYPAGTFYRESLNAVNYVIFNDEDIKIKEHFQFQKQKEEIIMESTENLESQEYWKNQFQQENAETFKAIDDYLDKGIKPKNDEFIFEKVPEILKTANVSENEIVIKTSIINKAKNEHSLSDEEIKDSIKNIASPVLIFDSDKTTTENKKESFLCLTDTFAENGKPIAFSMNLDSDYERKNRLLEINEIRSIHDRTLIAKNGTDLIQKWTENGLCRYVDDKKISEWSKAAGVQFPLAVLQSDINNILSESDIVNGKKISNLAKEREDSFLLPLAKLDGNNINLSSNIVNGTDYPEIRTFSKFAEQQKNMEKEYQEYLGTISPDEESSRRIDSGEIFGKLENQQAKEELNVSTYKFQSGETLNEIIQGNSDFPTEAALLDNMIDGNIREVYEYATNEEKTVLKQFAAFRNDYDTDMKNLAVQTDCVSRWIAAKHWNPEKQEFQEDYVNHAAVAEFPYKLPWEMKEIEAQVLQTANETIDNGIESIQVNGGMSEAAIEADYEATEKENIPELKIHSELKEEKIKNLEIITQEEFDRIIDALYQDGKPDYKNIPEIIRLPKLNDELTAKLNIDNENFFLKTNIAHSRPQRKGGYDQSLRKEEMKGMLDFITSCQTAYIDTDERHQNFFLAGLDEKDNTKANKIVFNKDKLGNYIVTIGKVEAADFNSKNYAKVAVGVEPTIWRVQNEHPIATMLRSSTTLATEETIPQVTQKSINEQKTKLQILEQEDKEQLEAIVMTARETIKESLAQEAEPLVEIDFSKANYNSLFPFGIVQTPLEKVKLGENQFEKLDAKDRKRFLLATFQTLATPDIVIDEEREGSHSHNYIKSFVFDEKTKAVQDVVVNINGENISITAHPRDINNVVNKIKMPDQLVYAAAKVGQMIEQRVQNELGIVNPTRADRLSTISVPLNKDYNEDFALSTVKKLLETEKNTQNEKETEFQQIEPGLQKKFDKLKAVIKSREEQDTQGIASTEEPENKRQVKKSKSDIIRQAGKDFLESVKKGIAPFFNAEDDFQRIIMHPQSIINASNGLPFSGESQLLAQIYHKQHEMEGEIVTSIAGAKSAGTIVLDTPESRQKNFALTDTSSLAEKNSITRTRYFMPESCEEPDKIYAHTLQQQRPDKIRSYRDLIRHFENIPNGQKEIADIRIRIAHEHLKEIQSRLAIKEERTLSVEEIEERKNFLRNYFERLPSDYRASERGAFEDTFGVQLNPEKTLEINLQRNFKDIDFDELKKNTKKSIELENRKLSDFIEKNTMENKKLATLFSDEYKSVVKEEKLTAKNLKIEALGIKEPETFLGKYLAACNTNAEFITDKETVDEAKKNLVKKLEENFKLEKYDILKEIGQQAQSISNETIKQISFEKAHSNNKSLEKSLSPDKEISLIGMGK